MRVLLYTILSTVLLGCTTVERGKLVSNEQSALVTSYVFTVLPAWKAGECQPWFFSCGLSDVSIGLEYAEEQAMAARQPDEMCIIKSRQRRDDTVYTLFGWRYFEIECVYVKVPTKEEQASLEIVSEVFRAISKK